MSGYFSGFFVGIFGIVIVMIWIVIHFWYVIIPLVIIGVVWYLYNNGQKEKAREQYLQKNLQLQQKQKTIKDKKREQRLTDQLFEIQKEQQNLLKFEEIDISELKEFMLFAKIWKKRMESKDKEFFNN
jgi:hypothetical protein